MEINYSELVSIKNVNIQRINGTEISSFSDTLSIEEPLEIRISYGSRTERIQKNISVTMRTPGNDRELAVGFLFTEGIIGSFEDVERAYPVEMNCMSKKQNIVQVDLTENFSPNLMQTDRNFYTTSSCGVCGKSSIQSIKTVSPFGNLVKPARTIDVTVFYTLPQKLRTAQSDFASTGGIHASGLFDIQGNLILLTEDVGRHNALDKLIGQSLMNKSLPLKEHILLLSGRASFELIQKAAMAGISVIASIGAPSSLAVELAKEFNITLLGFLKENRLNVYSTSDQTVITTG
ncbi:formate dehydrogenase accessory sulfurtransferase FdhD [Flavobacterium sp. LC2016-23]|uniref:formate dehydrogenase accessory sulfurtransferase FdhD n=1 Tax=Flavobacterium sp. LC2016-23 TaxID=2666330 RepID=UPI0012B0E8D7|nr:formate dehydrogenase accessory sulfurtransferase FdhD [Flavobacterium sp. LC2016-23]MRX40227.1 formate dehydrogenase accessory sulfurtransferase FdhD [Flavobacterium sp. LC2016-23]